MALEDDAVKTGEDGDDQAGKLGDEARQRLHGVLLRGGAGANPILAGERLACSSYLVAALPRWEGAGKEVEPQMITDELRKEKAEKRSGRSIHFFHHMFINKFLYIAQLFTS